MHKYMQYEASMTVYIGRTAIQRKVTKWLSFQKMQVRMTEKVIIIY